jgi:hypothetical protein
MHVTFGRKDSKEETIWSTRRRVREINVDWGQVVDQFFWTVNYYIFW